MRRPVKPFVTEYKGNARRLPPQAGLSLKLEDEDQPAPHRQGTWRSEAARSSDSQRSPGLSHPADDSYEAALRAADALFSNSPKRTDTSSGQKDEADHADAAVSSTAPAHPGAGRILRVLDEAQPQAVTDHEVEHTPKRRGRKPGSKNKPKALTAFIEEPVETHAAERTPVAPLQTPAIMTMPDEQGSRVAASVAPAPAPTQTVRAPGLPRPRVEPYAWVKTKLKPGERWKRRLPKVAW